MPALFLGRRGWAAIRRGRRTVLAFATAEMIGTRLWRRRARYAGRADRGATTWTGGQRFEEQLGLGGRQSKNQDCCSAKLEDEVRWQNSGVEMWHLSKLSIATERSLP